jgi:hypothetical protein
LDACSIQSRRYRKGFHVESLAKRSKSSSIHTKDVADLVKVSSDKNEKQDLATIHSISESENQVNSKSIAKKNTTGKVVSKVKLAKQYRTIKSFKKLVDDSLQKKNYPTLKTIPSAEGTHNKVAVGAFVLAMVSIFCTLVSVAIPIFSLLAFLTALVSFILAIVAMVQFGKDTRKGKGLAIAALVLSILYFLFFLVVLFLIAATI